MSVHPIGPAWPPQPQQGRSAHDAAAPAAAATTGAVPPAAITPAAAPVILAPLRGASAAAPFLAQMIDQEVLGSGRESTPADTMPAVPAIGDSGAGSRAHAVYSAAPGTRPPAGLAADIEV